MQKHPVKFPVLSFIRFKTNVPLGFFLNKGLKHFAVNFMKAATKNKSAWNGSGSAIRQLHMDGHPPRSQEGPGALGVRGRVVSFAGSAQGLVQRKSIIISVAEQLREVDSCRGGFELRSSLRSSHIIIRIIKPDPIKVNGKL